MQVCTLRKRYTIAIVTIVLGFTLLGEAMAKIQIPKRSREGPARAAINHALENWREGVYEASDVVDIDSLKGDMKFFVEPLEDPYGTLANCFVFTTRIRPNAPLLDSPIYLGDFNAIGIYKNGNILWISDTTIAKSDGYLLTTRDINTDGFVEILTEWNDGHPYGESEIWIHSWNSTLGWRINAVREEKYSVIIGPGTGFGLFDAEGDGVLEIKNIDRTDGSLTYSWNGQEYGMWANTPHLSEATWLPRNNFSMTINCAVRELSNGLEYAYDVTNAPTSKQRVDALYFEQEVDSVQVLSPTGWQLGGVLYFDLKLGWNTVVMDHKGHIRPGQTLSGFKIRSPNVPTIVNWAAQAYNDVPDPELVPAYDSGRRNDIENNAIWGQTIGPKTPPPIEPFASLAFTDTLLSYVTRSRTLNWILDQSTANKYTGLFTRVRSDLDQQNKATAQLRLDTVLAQVRQDSAAHLTSEAHALLRFNTEYLKTMIPDDPLPIQLWYFTVEVQTNLYVLLEWGTLSETNNYGFEVQKSTSATSGFTSIPGSFTPGHGTTQEPHEYSYTDQNTSAGTWYYRLKQIDLDATIHYTDALQVYVPTGSTQIANFTAILLTDNTVRLDWMTLRERNNSGFDVQESGMNPIRFETIRGSFTPGHGTTDQPYYYSFIDPTEAFRYRLKQIDTDGTLHYSDTVIVSIPAGGIDLVGFTASVLSQQGIQLQWSTRRETDNSRFVVEASRGDSLHFRPIPNAIVPGHGTTTQPWKYSYRDTQRRQGVMYYRLKQANTVGRVRYTRNVKVTVQ